MRATLTTRAVLTAAAAGLLVLPAAPSAFAAVGGGTYTVPVHQTPPVTAAGFGEHEAKCGSIGTDKDGWHFVLPGNSTDFVKLTVVFDNGAPQVVTVFGPPTTKHAYVASAPGATLTSASAEVQGGEVQWFNLSHTCPAVVSSPSATPSTPAPSTSTTPGTTASPSATTSTTPSASVSPSASSSASASTGASSSPTATTTPSTGSTVDAVAGSPSPSASTAVSGSGSLASTGANIGLTLTAALGLVGAGTFLVMRRRRAGQH